jgi:hypothetical protein
MRLAALLMLVVAWVRAEEVHAIDFGPLTTSADIAVVESSPVVAIKDGSLLCNDGECVVVRFGAGRGFTLEHVSDKALMAAVRRYTVANPNTELPETPQDAAATTCTGLEARTATITGLTTGTTYSYRIACAGGTVVKGEIATQ